MSVLCTAVIMLCMGVYVCVLPIDHCPTLFCGCKPRPMTPEIFAWTLHCLALYQLVMCIQDCMNTNTVLLLLLYTTLPLSYCSTHSG